MPLVPVGHFSRLSSKDLETVWQVCGPAAVYNLQRDPLWKAIAAAYIEGLQHGSEIERQRRNVVEPG